MAGGSRKRSCDDVCRRDPCDVYCVIYVINVNNKACVPMQNLPVSHARKRVINTTITGEEELGRVSAPLALFAVTDLGGNVIHTAIYSNRT